MADQPIIQQTRVLDAAGAPVSGALARFYTPGTLSPVDVFLDEAMTILAPRPLVASSAGVFPQVWTSAAVKVNVTTATGAAVPGYPLDPAPRSIGDLGAAGSVSFAPSALLPFDTVQEAVDGLAARVGTVTAQGQALMGAATAAIQRAALGFGAADINMLAATGANARVVSTNWNLISGSGWYFGGSGAANAPVDGGFFTALASQESSNSMVVIAVRVGADEVYVRRKVSGTWASWFRLATFTGEAPAYSVRAWLNYNGSTGTILGAGNIASVTDHGVGDFTLNFTTDLPGANYAVSGAIAATSSVYGVFVKSDTDGGAPVTKTAGAVRIAVRAESTYLDAENISITIVR